MLYAIFATLLRMAKPTFTIAQRAAAWGVHLFTASGLVAGFMALLAVHEGAFREAALWLLLTLVIDGIDGTFARLARAETVLPQMSGQTIDYVIDFATYAIIPAFFFYEAQLVSPAWNLPCAAIILFVSALYYGKSGMVSEDYYFVGFPVMWNVVVFFLFFVWTFPPLVNVALVIAFATLHFVPIKFAYPSRNSRFMKLTLVITAVFVVSLVWLIWQYPVRSDWAVGGCYVGLLYYALLAVYDTWFVPYDGE